MDRYIGRCVDCLVERDLGIFGAVLIQGPKWCGKTTHRFYYANILCYPWRFFGHNPSFSTAEARSAISRSS